MYVAGKGASFNLSSDHITFIEINLDIISKVILPSLQIQAGHVAITGNTMYTKY